MIPLRFTHLKAFARSAAHYQHCVTTERPDNAAMRLGRLVHWQVLGNMPDDEDGRIVIYNGKRTDGNKWKEFAEKNAGNEIVTSAEWERSLPIANAVRKDKLAASILDGCELERHLMWKIGDRICSSRPDGFRPGVHLFDLKTTSNAGIVELQRQAWRMHYHAQLSFYGDALKYHSIDVPQRYIIGVEVNPPHPVTVLSLTDALIEEGRRAYRGWFEMLRVCEDNDHWPGYAQHVVQWDVPAWIEMDSDDEEEAAA